MVAIQPFGTNSSSGVPDLGRQTFLGLTVVDFSCSSSWGSSGGDCTINLIQDPELNQYLEEAVVGSPQYFEIVDQAGNPVFRYYGILQKISRDASADGSKAYSVTLQSPSVLLEACYTITDQYAGYGGALEAVHPNVPACLDYGHLNSNITPSNIFNILNLYGAYENESYGFTGAGFGKSIVNNEGMRLDFYAYAVDEMLNGNTQVTPELGSNIIFGKDSYGSGNAYAYNFDINGFIEQIIDYVPSGYRVTSDNLMGFVDDLCSETNHVYLIDLLKPVGAGSSAFGSEHETTQTPTLTHSGTVYGGQIKIITQNMNNVGSVAFPLSSGIIAGEISDKLGGSGQLGDLPLDIGMSGVGHPDGLPVSTSPFGGLFPSEDISLNDLQKYTSTSLNVVLNGGATAAKYVVGGYQSRMNFVARDLVTLPAPEITGSTCSSSPPATFDSLSNIMCYWGDINVYDQFSSAVLRKVPVITPYLDSHPYLQHMEAIMIDISSFFSGDISGLVVDAIYPCSVMELRAALVSYPSWRSYLDSMKPGKIKRVSDYFSVTLRKYKNSLYRADGVLTEFGRAMLTQYVGRMYSYATSASDAHSNPTCNISSVDGVLTYGIGSTAEDFMQSLYEQIKKIGSEHYGRSFIAKIPAFTLMRDADDEAPLNSFTPSWELSDDAYLDPISYSSYEAPQNSSFVNNGRLKGYANFSHGFSSPYRHIDYNFSSVSPYSIPLPAAYNYFDFSQYQYDQVSISSSNVSVPITLDKTYVYTPASYFTIYHPENFASYLNNISTGTTVAARYALANVPSEALTVASYLRSVQINENGIGMKPFAKFSIAPVFLPGGRNPSLNELWSMVGAACSSIKVNSSTSGSSNGDQIGIYPMAIMPRSVGIPQQSNRFVYGPWITNISLNYGAKIEYEQISDLVPENYVIPSTINLGGGDISVLSGYAGLNFAGNLIANAVDGFDNLFTEEGQIEMPGLPLITSIGQSLIEGGPLVSDISVNVGASNVTTSYSMSTFAPKFGRTNKHTLDIIKKLSKRITRE